MKKIIGALALLVGTMAYSQVTFGLRANALFNTSSANWSELANTVKGQKENTGFNVGLSAKVKFPVSGWFVMPELYYTTIKNEATVNNVTLEAKSNRIDLPVLLGHDFLLGKLGAFVGPVLSYNLSTSNTFQDFKENATKEFTVGYQFGAQATLSNFVINARYEGAFSKDSRTFINNVTGAEAIRYDNRPSMFILGVGYNF